MSFSALLGALLLEYFRPLTRNLRLYDWFFSYANYLERQFNAGEHHHGALAWVLALAPFVLLVVLISTLLQAMSGPLGWMWSLIVLYFLMGFGTLGANAAAVVSALRNQQLDQARSLLEQWVGRESSNLSATEVARLGIEEILITAYRKLFGIILWFMLLGPAGALLYRLAQILAQKWGGLNEQEFGNFGNFSVRVFAWMEWLPARLTALSFAIMGDFEDAMYCWRSQAKQWMEEGLGIVLASGAGAIGVRLGEPVETFDGIESRPEIGLGDDADVDYMDSAISLIWRTLMLWLVVLLLIALVRWTGA
ncbi:MAG: CobD/CbiB family protein [Gammaproteobacteria bacterium]|nr:CobD/CbiB family protein [Gammaproteobacteria bacterium]MBU1732331.1 CobD/CbiB family protein [Gammaproteobacteria bacterium]MBU1893901.1 CobD/CbiB family protein [Gammaproteobacteria bacterium]